MPMQQTDRGLKTWSWLHPMVGSCIKFGVLFVGVVVLLSFGLDFLRKFALVSLMRQGCSCWIQDAQRFCWFFSHIVVSQSPFSNALPVSMLIVALFCRCGGILSSVPERPRVWSLSILCVGMGVCLVAHFGFWVFETDVVSTVLKCGQSVVFRRAVQLRFAAGSDAEFPNAWPGLANLFVSIAVFCYSYAAASKLLTLPSAMNRVWFALIVLVIAASCCFVVPMALALVVSGIVTTHVSGLIAGLCLAGCCVLLVAWQKRSYCAADCHGR